MFSGVFRVWSQLLDVSGCLGLKGLGPVGRVMKSFVDVSRCRVSRSV